MKDIYEAAQAAATMGNAPLKTVSEPGATRSKSFRAIPQTYFEAYDWLVANGLTSLTFTSYMMEACREKMIRDGAPLGNPK